MKKSVAVVIFLGAMGVLAGSIYWTLSDGRSAKDYPLNGPTSMGAPGGGGKSGAPGGTGRQGRPGGRLAQMVEQLGLTADQKTQFEKIQKEIQPKIDALRKDGAQPDRAAMAAIRKERDDKVNAILTAEQRTKLEKLREAGRAQGGGQRGGPGGMGPAPSGGKALPPK